MLHFIKKLYYGDIPDASSGAAPLSDQQQPATDWPLWEVFIRSKQGLDHKHVRDVRKA